MWMYKRYEAKEWKHYTMDWHDPHRQIEPLDQEIEVIDEALNVLVQEGVLAHARYDAAKMLAHRAAVREHFDIPWTAVSPRMQRLLYAINAIAQPRVMVAVGVFCGFTYISNAGAGVGPGACYEPEHLVGIEIRPNEADRARRNVATIDRTGDGVAEIVAADGIAWLRDTKETVDLLYLDADGPAGKGKSIYLDLVQSALHALRLGSLVLAHNSVNAADSMADYLDYVRDRANFTASVNMVVDDQGLEVSCL
jgi:predicted O-methyltransferase YrrM